MSNARNLKLSVVVPLYNEASGLVGFNKKLVKTIESVSGSYELIYCDDGSTDNTSEMVRDWRKTNKRIKLLRLSRNFGKENALTAGIGAASGEAVLTLDGDGQHPIELIPRFVEAWQGGAKVVIGIRKSNKDEGWFKRFGSRFFYAVFNKFTTRKLQPGATDFRLIDRAVQQAFLSMPETDRITRGLIDWLGFERELIYFQANARVTGTATYDKNKLIKLATDSLVSLTPTPLYLFGYLGIVITIGAFFLGLSVFIEQILINDPWHWRFTGTAMLGILILFLVGILLMSQGMLSLYISSIQKQSRQRPLFIVDKDASTGIDDNQKTS